MNKNKKQIRNAKLALQRQNVRVLTPIEMRGAAGGLRGGCCIDGTELMSPETQVVTKGGCCIQGTELMSPYTA
jgi:hypothetical protein